MPQRSTIYQGLIATALCAALGSCAGKKKDETPGEPVKPPTQATAPKPPTPDAIAEFKTPQDETLPTPEQLKQGADTSVGTVGAQPINTPDSAPSTAAKPPKSSKPDEDQLDPGP